MLFTNRGLPLSDSLSETLDEATGVLIAAGYVTQSGCELLKLSRRSQRIPVRIVVGRAESDGLDRGTLNFLSNLHQDAVANGGGVRVGSPPFHSKIFCVLRDGPDAVWVGSSNLTRAGVHTGREATLRLQGDEAEEVLEEAERLWASGVAIIDAEIDVVTWQRRPAPKREGEPREEPDDRPRDVPEPDLEDAPYFCSDFAPEGYVYEQSGPNFWNGGGRERDPNECQIALRHGNREAAGRVFGEVESGLEFDAITHDGRRIEMQLEGAGGKNITARGGGKALGKWLLRDVLELDEWELLTLEHLRIWGRTEICFFHVGLLDNGRPLVYIDFSAPPIEGTPDEPWTEEETRLAIRTYFLMVKQELSGENYTKARHRRRAMKRLPARTSGSLKFKLQNVSAVLEEMGMDWLQGYAPREHHERTLMPALVAEHLERNPDLRAELGGREGNG